MANPKPYRELTPTSLVAGVLFGAVLNAGICYAGLQIGFTIVGSAVAAVVGFGLLRGLIGPLGRLFGAKEYRPGSILEVNIFQTVASSVNTVNAGVIFTVPVLFLLGFADRIDYWSLGLATIAGSALGVIMIIPLRKQIIDYERLRFPEGVAVATILKSPGAGMQKAVLLLIGFIVSAIISALTKYWGPGEGATLLPESLHLEESLGLPPAFSLTFAISLLSLGAGFLAGRPGLVVLYGTLLNFWVVIPVAIWLGWVPEQWGEFQLFDRELLAGPAPLREAYYAAGEAFKGDFAHFTSRHLGIGMILGGAIAGILVALPAIKAAIASLRSPSGPGGRQEEVSMNVLNTGLVIGMVLLFIATKLSGGGSLSWGITFAVTLAGGIWLWLAGLVVAQTTGRTDWSPLSGLALIAIAIMMGIMGTEEQFVVPAVTVGAAICVATSMCADMMADLKTGYLVGSMPRKQQIAQILTCCAGPAISLATIIVLWKAYAFGPEQPQILYARAEAQGPAAVASLEEAGGSPSQLAQGVPTLGAPQAGALEAAINIVQSGDVPLGKYLTGAFLGLLISLLVSPGLGVMVGLSMYLPFEYMAVFGMGGIASILLTKWKGARFTEDKGVPVAAGLIVGDALVGVAHAIVKVASAAGGAS